MRKIIALVLVGTLAACGRGPQEPAPIEPKIYPETRVLSPETRQALTGFTLTNAPACLEYTNPSRPPCQATLTFSGSSAQLAELAVGQILVSEPTPKAPYGLLQKVKSIQQVGSTFTVQTEEANIGEAIEQGEAEFEKTLKPNDLQSARALAQSVRFSNGLSAYSSQSGVRPMLSMDFSFNEVLYDQDDNPSTTGDQVRVQGKFFFDVQNSFNTGLKWKKVLGVPVYPNGIYFKAVLGVKYDSEVKVFSGVSHNINKEVKLAEYTFSPITVMVGPVPLVFVPQLVVKATASGQIAAQVSYAATQNIGAQACMEYKSGFSNCSTFGKNFSAGPTSAKVSANARATLLGQANVLLYGVVGPYAKVGPYLELDAQVPRNPVWKLNAGIQAFLGLHLGIDFGPVDFSLNWDFKFWDENLGTLAQSPPQPPTLNFSQGFGGAQLLKPIQLCASAFDPQDGPRPLSLSSSVGSDNPLAGFPASSSLACQNYIFSTEGSRTLTVSASNSAGLSASKTLTLQVLDPPPSVEVYNPKPTGTYYAGGTVLLQGSWLDPSLNTQDCTRAVWRSNVAGDNLPANACGTPTVSLSSSTVGRTLTLEVSNARNKKGSASVSFSVQSAPPNYPPQVVIKEPTGNEPPQLDTPQIVLKGWVQDQENDSVNYIWKIAELSGTGVPGPQQNVPGGSGTVSPTSSGTYLPTVTITNLLALFPSPGCGRVYRLYLEATDSQPGPPPRPVVATQDFKLTPCIN